MAAHAPCPDGFVDLRSAHDTRNQPLSIMGVVVDFLPIAKTSGTDFVFTCTLNDPSWLDGMGLIVRLFNKSQEKFPVVTKVGDVLLLRNIKVGEYGGATIALSNFSTSWVLYPEAVIPHSLENSSSDLVFTLSPNGARPKPVEAKYAVALCNMQDRASFSLNKRPMPTSLQTVGTPVQSGGQSTTSKQKFSLVQDLSLPLHERHLIFVDLLGEVRRFYSNDFRVELTITDYTSNQHLFNNVAGGDDEGLDGDPYCHIAKTHNPWPGPWGRTAITVTLWDAHANSARNSVKTGDFVYLQNVQIKLGRDGGKIEGNLRGNRYDPSRINVEVVRPRNAVGDERIKSLLQRKREYEIKAKAQKLPFIRDPSNSEKEKPAAEVEEQGDSKKKGKNRKNKGKNRKAAQASVDEDHQAEPSKVQKIDPHTNVRCIKVDVPLTPISQIMDSDILLRKTPKGNDFSLPFQASCYRSKIRVVDYFPDNIADFAAPFRESVYDILSDNGNDSDSDSEEVDDHSQGDVRWEWRFMLLVEDSGPPPPGGGQKERMLLLVAETDGEYLLNMDAVDLRNDPRQLATLREKLFFLWGDLQERKEEDTKSGEEFTPVRGSANPFECCIKEYGIPARNGNHAAVRDDLSYDRMFRMFGTTIK